MTVGMKKHARSGNAVNCEHFTGTKKSSSKYRKRKSSRKQRNMKKHSHINKYRAVA